MTQRLLICIFLLLSTNQILASNIERQNIFIAPSDNQEESVLLVRINTSNSINKVKHLEHLTEHMLFKGTEKFPKFTAFVDYLDKNGAVSNARTGEGYIDFYYIIKNEQLQKYVERIFSQFHSPLFSPAQIKKELIPFKEEVNKNKSGTFNRLIRCEYEQSSNFKYVDDVLNLPTEELSKSMHQFYNEVWRADNVSLFFWSALSSKKIYKTLETATDNLFMEGQSVGFVIDNSSEKTYEDTEYPSVYFCDKAKSTYEFILSFPLYAHYVQQDIELFFLEEFRRKGKGTFSEQLQKHTSFNHALFLASTGHLRIGFYSENEYDALDAVKAKQVFFDYLNTIIARKLSNSIRKNMLLNKLMPIQIDTSYYSIRTKFHELAKKKFAGQDLEEQLQSFSTYILNSEKKWGFTTTPDENVYKKIPVLEEKVTSEISASFKDIKLNEYFPVIKVEQSIKQKKSKVKTESLTMLTHNIGIQSVSQKENSSELTSLLLEIKNTNNLQEPSLFYSKVKEQFEKDNKEFLTSLSESYVNLQLEGKDSLKVLLLSHHSNFNKVAKELITRLKVLLTQQNGGSDYATRYLLLGYLRDTLITEVKENFAEHFDLQIKFLDEEQIESYPEINPKECQLNCLRYPLHYWDYKKARAFGAIMEKLSANELFHKIRFNQGLSYDAGITSLNFSGKPELRVYLSNNEVNHEEKLKLYFEETNVENLSNAQVQFDTAKQKLLDKFDNKTELLNLVKYQWDKLLTRNTLFQDILDERQALEDLTHDEFMQIYKTLILKNNL